MEEQSIYTLAECVDEYLAQRFISKKKYYSSFLICAKNYWKKLFRNTIYAVNSEWKTLKKGTPYNFIEKPKDAVRVFSISTVDSHCNKIVDLFYDTRFNVIPKPTTSQKKCGCGSCDCGGLCDDIGSLTYTTKLLFSISGVDYYEKIWVKVCPNGDVIEYRIVPTKKYNDFTGDSGDYMNDYMNDYDIGSPAFSNYTIVYPEFQKVICKLDVKPCGCPENTTENIELLNEFCGCFLPVNACCKKRHCDDFLEAINSNHLGSIKISECGNKFYYIPSKKQKTLPEFLLINYQTSGENCSEVVQVPEYALDAMWLGTDYFSKRFNNSYSLSEKDAAKYAACAGENDLIVFLNPLSLRWLSTLQDSEIKW